MHHLWDENEKALAWSRCFEFEYGKNIEILSEMENKVDIVFPQTKIKKDEHVIEDIVKMLQGVESECFLLNYETM